MNVIISDVVRLRYHVFGLRKELKKISLVLINSVLSISKD